MPLTALKNKEIDYDREYYEQTFEIEWLVFLVVYSGAVQSDGSIKDLVRKIRRSMGIEKLYAKILVGESSETD